MPSSPKPKNNKREATGSCARRSNTARPQPEIASAKERQQSAFELERQRWRDFGLDSYVADDPGVAGLEGGENFPDDITPVHAPSGASIWKIAAVPGDAVAKGQTLIIVEAMKMEIQITAPIAGILRELRCQPGNTVKPGQVLALIGSEP